MSEISIVNELREQFQGMTPAQADTVCVGTGTGRTVLCCLCVDKCFHCRLASGLLESEVWLSS